MKFDRSHDYISWGIKIGHKYPRNPESPETISPELLHHQMSPYIEQLTILFIFRFVFAQNIALFRYIRVMPTLVPLEPIPREHNGHTRISNTGHQTRQTTLSFEPKYAQFGRKMDFW